MDNILISFLVPALNEERTIEKIILDIKNNIKKIKLESYEIIVSDNGSTDRTLKILRGTKNVKVINTKIKGYGSALHSGILEARGKFVIYADADLSYRFSNLSSFIKLVDQNPDLVLGSRIQGNINDGAMPFLHHHIGTPILSFIIRILYKIPTTDCNSGMRMLRTSFYKKLKMKNAGMEWASELLVKTGIKNGKYLEVPIQYFKDKRGRSPHLSTWSDGWRHLKAIILLRPSNLFLMIVACILIAILSYKISFTLTFLFLDLSVVLFLSFFTLELLSSVVDEKTTMISNFTREFKLVPITIIISIVVGLSTIIVPDTRLGTKLFIVSVLGIIFMWIFLVETIKTHLINKLS